MKIEPLEIHQDTCKPLVIDVSCHHVVRIYHGGEKIVIERSNIQELIGVLKHEVTE